MACNNTCLRAATNLRGWSPTCRSDRHDWSRALPELIF